MTDYIRAREFRETEGTEDWRVVGDGACTFIATDSFASSVRLVQAIGALPGVEDHRPDLDVRHDGVTVRLLTAGDDWYGMSRRDVSLARGISGAVRDLDPHRGARSGRSGAAARSCVAQSPSLQGSGTVGAPVGRDAGRAI